MKHPVSFDDDATAEYENAVEWYETQRSGLGARLIKAVDECVNRIALNPQLHGVVHLDIRKALVSGFPYCVFYIPKPTHVRIISVFHTSRDPAIWKGRR